MKSLPVSTRSIWRPAMAAALLVLGSLDARASEPAVPTPEEATLLKADADFCQLCQVKGMAESFVAFATEDSVMLVPGEGQVKGKTDIRRAMSGTEGYKLIWKPLRAEVARSGDLGYTYGTYEMSAPGAPTARTGQYTTVWKKQGDGSWKYVLDVGNQDPPAAPTKHP